MTRVPIKVPMSRPEALALLEAHGRAVLEDQARIDPNPNGAAAQLLEALQVRQESDAIWARLKASRVPAFKPTTLGMVRAKGFTGMRVHCRLCDRTWTTPIGKLSAAQDGLRLKDLLFPHDGCAAEGAAFMTADPV